MTPPLPTSRRHSDKTVSHEKPVPLWFGDLYDTGKNNFNLLRLTLSVLVLFSHCFPMMAAPFEPLDWVSQRQFTLGTLSVNAFFVISGFLISASWEHSKNMGDFALRRILRVYPGYVVCLIFCAFLVGPLSNGNVADYFTHLRTHSAASIFRLQDLPGVFPNNPLPLTVNGSLWTIRYEIYCYALLALLGMATSLRRHWVLGAFAFCYMAYNVLVPLGEARFIGGLPGPLTLEYLPRLTTYFFAGAAFWVCRQHIPFSPKWTAIAAVFFLLGLRFFPHWLVPLAGTYLLMAAAFSRRFCFYNFGKRFDFSYGIYLYAFPIQQLLVQRFSPHFMPLTLFFIALPVAVFAAWCSWSFVEKPFLRLKKRTVDRAETQKKVDIGSSQRVS